MLEITVYRDGRHVLIESIWRLIQYVNHRSCVSSRLGHGLYARAWRGHRCGHLVRHCNRGRKRLGTGTSWRLLGGKRGCVVIVRQFRIQLVQGTPIDSTKVHKMNCTTLAQLVESSLGSCLAIDAPTVTNHASHMLPTGSEKNGAMSNPIDINCTSVGIALNGNHHRRPPPLDGMELVAGLSPVETSLSGTQIFIASSVSSQESSPQLHVNLGSCASMLSLGLQLKLLEQSLLLSHSAIARGSIAHHSGDQEAGAHVQVQVGWACIRSQKCDY